MTTSSRLRMNSWRSMILFVLLVFSAACQPVASSVPASTPTPFSLAKIELFRNQLKVANISHYRFQLFQGCICEDNEDVLFEVEDGQMVSVEYQSGRDMNPYDRPYFENWGTMEPSS